MLYTFLYNIGAKRYLVFVQDLNNGDGRDTAWMIRSHSKCMEFFSHGRCLGTFYVLDYDVEMLVTVLLLSWYILRT